MGHQMMRDRLAFVLLVVLGFGQVLLALRKHERRWRCDCPEHPFRVRTTIREA